MMACHINWHSAVYHVENGNYDAALEIFDNAVSSLFYCVVLSIWIDEGRLAEMSFEFRVWDELLEEWRVFQMAGAESEIER